MWLRGNSWWFRLLQMWDLIKRRSRNKKKAFKYFKDDHRELSDWIWINGYRLNGNIKSSSAWAGALRFHYVVRREPRLNRLDLFALHYPYPERVWFHFFRGTWNEPDNEAQLYSKERAYEQEQEAISTSIDYFVPCTKLGLKDQIIINSIGRV